MKPFVVIRKLEGADNLQCQTVVKDFVMAGAWDAFVSCLFREITLQLVVIVWAIMFIFFGIPLLMCCVAIPIVVGLILFTTYGSYFNKANELAIRGGNKLCWVAEMYEPLVFDGPLEIDRFYEDVPKVDKAQLSKMRRKIVGTISCRSHLILENSGWIYRLAVSPRYPFAEIAEQLIIRVLSNAFDNQLFTVETVTSECDECIREVYLKLGFTLRLAYHKQIVGNTLKVMKSLIGIDPFEWNQNREQIKVELEN
ncbi:conserved hypothetical protein [Culex quinquefasciatus]|uniref:N-acetyltransferase domain-containing protein n=1 Tax=Culex quinquefasciatus TaxID=7176 RepID=B0WYW6_CULQU|nr:uncharacterized protein LOC6045190 [Culex quinquefasciatus]EDS37226.1 conserved hypothetical protein [Culex quinquefasciatus]|eukprot:XP_001862588.1 conserved hypothetical protein [Culex quinquefasciatus]